MTDDLLALAEELARREPGRPRQVSLRRAISTAYYALFHAVCFECADALVGWNMHWRYVSPLYRSVEHAAARKVFEQSRSWGAGYESVADIGRIFTKLQAVRMLADYDPEYSDDLGNRGNVLELVASARQSVAMLRSLSKDQKRYLAVQLLRKHR